MHLPPLIDNEFEFYVVDRKAPVLTAVVLTN